ncbi:MAG: transposase [Phycisphaerales bacterium]|nr:transposase [Phycisphaerales bacterium]
MCLLRSSPPCSPPFGWPCCIDAEGEGEPGNANRAATTCAAAAAPDITHFAGFDWAGDHHDLVVVDGRGAIVLQLRFDDTADGWGALAERLAACGATPAHTAVAIETSAGSAVQRLLDLGLAVYPVNPMAARRYRERKAPAGAKDDQLDAWSMADALRLDGLRADGLGWRRLVPDDPIVQELRLLCRDEVELIAQRTALVNQLRAALREYYPAALEAFDDWTRPHGWHLVIRFPTPHALAAAGRRQWERFLKQHGLNRPQTRENRLACFARAAGFCSSNAAITAAKSRLAVALTTMLLALQGQLDEYRRRIGELFDRHPDHDLFGSLPGAGGKLAPRLLAELGADRTRFEDPQALQCFAGTAPVSFTSGQIHRVKLRRACNKHLRARRCTCGRTSAARPVPGHKPITSVTATAASPTPARCAAWASGGSRSSGRCGSAAPATTRPATWPTNNASEAPRRWQPAATERNEAGVRGQRPRFATPSRTEFLYAKIHTTKNNAVAT